MKRQLRSIIVYGIIIVIFILAIIGTLVLDGNGAQSLIFSARDPQHPGIYSVEVKGKRILKVELLQSGSFISCAQYGAQVYTLRYEEKNNTTDLIDAGNQINTVFTRVNKKSKEQQVILRGQSNEHNAYIGYLYADNKYLYFLEGKEFYVCRMSIEGGEIEKLEIGAVPFPGDPRISIKNGYIFTSYIDSMKTPTLYAMNLKTLQIDKILLPELPFYSENHRSVRVIPDGDTFYYTCIDDKGKVVLYQFSFFRVNDFIKVILCNAQKDQNLSEILCAIDGGLFFVDEDRILSIYREGKIYQILDLNNISSEDYVSVYGEGDYYIIQYPKFLDANETMAYLLYKYDNKGGEKLGYFLLK